LIQVNQLLQSAPARILAVLALTGTAAEFIGPVVAAGPGVALVRVALGQSPPPLVGALEAGALASAVWWAFGA
jgi:hypothetical protein